jgi:hypothetical protein
LDLYLQYGEEVFPQLRWDFLKVRAGLRWVRALRHYSYDPAPLHHHLTTVFGDAIVGDATSRLSAR